MTGPSPRGQLVGYLVAHVLDDDGLIEVFDEDLDGRLPAHQTVDAARAARGDHDPTTWPVIELRIVPEAT